MTETYVLPRTLTVTVPVRIKHKASKRVHKMFGTIEIHQWSADPYDTTVRLVNPIEFHSLEPGAYTGPSMFVTTTSGLRWVKLPCANTSVRVPPDADTFTIFPEE